ncbi:hypothetical protein HS125_16380 [bacterium]|nr:hypothetical protein [bacterium]
MLVPVVVALVVGAGCWLLGRRSPALSGGLTLAAAVCIALACAQLWRQDEPLESVIPFFAMPTVTLQIALKSTMLGGFLAFVAAAFTALIALFSLGYRGTVQNPGKFCAYLLWSNAAALGVFYANDFLFLLFCWEALSVLLYLLIGQGREERAPAAAAKSLAVLGFSDGCLVLAVVLALASSGGARMDQFHVAMGGAGSYAMYGLFLVAALAKAGAYPVHTWLPTASEGAPISVMAFLPAALDKLLGIYLLARISFNYFTLDGALSTLLLILGMVTILSAVFMAMIQHDLPRLLSFHAVSQVGYMVLGLGTGNPIGIVGGLFHMLNHAIYKCCLFLCAGKLENRTGQLELDRLGGLARVAPTAFIGCVIAAMAISGIPPLNGFVSKWMIYQGVLSMQSPLGAIAMVVAVFGSALTLASFVKVVYSCYWGAASDGLVIRSEPRPWATGVPIAVLAGLCILLGVWAYAPVNFLSSVAEFDLRGGVAPAFAGETLAPASGFWSPTTATALILVGLALGLLLYAVTRTLKFRSVPNFVSGERLSGTAVRYSGASFYSTIRELPVLSVMYTDGEAGVYDPYRLGGRYGYSLVQTLRRLHTGVLLVYLSWCILGLALIMGFLLAEYRL